MNTVARLKAVFSLHSNRKASRCVPPLLELNLPMWQLQISTHSRFNHFTGGIMAACRGWGGNIKINFDLLIFPIFRNCIFETSLSSRIKYTRARISTHPFTLWCWLAGPSDWKYLLDVNYWSVWIEVEWRVSVLLICARKDDELTCVI